jgi:hypothetical protein
LRWFIGWILVIKYPKGSFVFLSRNLDSMLGRTAHIEFLENEIVLKMIMFCLPDLFT